MGRKAPIVLEGRLSRAATAGVYFEADLLEPSGLTQLEANWPEDTSLSLERGKTGIWKLSGTVAKARLYELTLRGQRNGKEVQVHLRLPASPDPWTLWKDLPVDWTQRPFPKADQDHAEMRGDLHIIAASRRGRSHAHKALPRDDDMRIVIDKPTGWHIAAVADGAGSAAYSRFGAQTAVEAAISALPPLLAGIDETANSEVLADALAAALDQTLKAAAQAVSAAANENRQEDAQFSTTLLIGIARKTQTGYDFASVSIGDGMIGLIGEDEDPRMITPDSGAFAGQTKFLTRENLENDPNKDARFHFRQVTDFKAFLLMSDGVSDPMFPSERATTQKDCWLSLLDRLDLTSASALCEWLHFKAKGEHDDRTIAVMLPAADAS